VTVVAWLSLVTLLIIVFWPRKPPPRKPLYVDDAIDDVNRTSASSAVAADEYDPIRRMWKP